MSAVAKISDRTILEITHLKGDSLNRKDLCALAELLYRAGADFQELDAPALKYLDVLPPQQAILFVASEASDAAIIRQYGLQQVVLPMEETTQPGWADFFRDYRGQVMLEIACSRIREAEAVLNAYEQTVPAAVSSLRLRGLEKQEPWLAAQEAASLKSRYGLAICLSPVNSLGMAGAICIEAINGAADWVTTSFCGKGGNGGWAPLEEVLMASVVVYGLKKEADTASLAETARLFSKLTGEFIPPQKAVVGSGIFRCESGIHADGIYKNPALYEPYPPELAGQQREIVIGKHSGAAALLRKLQELDLAGMETNQVRKVLARIREKSVELKRSLDAAEVREIAEEYGCRRGAG